MLAFPKTALKIIDLAFQRRLFGYRGLIQVGVTAVLCLGLSASAAARAADAGLPPDNADLRITKTDGVTSVLPGATVTYTMVVSNSGPDAADETVFRDPAVANLTVTGVSCSSAAGGAVCPVSGRLTVAALQTSGITILTLPSGGSVTFTVTGTAGTSGSIVNTATVTPPPDSIDPNTSNNSATDTNTITSSADLSVTKTDGVASVAANAALTYSIVVRNAGPSAANGAVLTDPAVANLTVTGVTCGSPTGGAACGATTVALLQGTGVVIPTLPSGGSVTFTVTGTAGASGSIANTATVTAPTGTTDPVGGNNSATDTTAINAGVDLRITITDGVTTVVPGQTLTYTIVATNGGPSGANGGSVSVPLPATLSGATWTCAAAGGAVCPAANGSGAISQTVATWPNGGALTYTLVATVSATATGSLSVTATTATPAGVTDSVPANNSATDTDTITAPQADLAITKTNGVTTITAGGTTTYTIVVTNNGPSSVTNATVSDVAPVGLTFGTWSCVASAGSACPASGSGNLSVSVSLIPNGTATFTVPATISSTATSPLTNTATTTVPAGITDPVPGNNSASDTDTVVAPTLTADLSVSKTDSVATVTSGGTTTYTIVVANAGPDAVSNATVTDLAAAGLVKTGLTCTAGGGAVCPTTPTVAQLEAGLTIPSLPNGGTVTLSLTVNVTAASGTVTNIVTVAVPGGVTDSTPANNSASDTNSVTAVAAQADLSVTKTNNVTSLTSGGTTIYSIVVNNAGPAAANGAIVTDPIAVGLSKTAVSCAAAGGAACPTTPTVSQLEAGLAIPTLPSGGSVTFSLTATVTAAGGNVSNVVNVAAPAGVTDPVPGNNSATDTDNVAAALVQADLTVTKTDGVTSVTSGATTTYTIVVTNGGPSAANGALLTDPAAAGLSKTALSCSSGGGAVCPAVLTVAQLEGGGLTIPTFPNGGTVTLTLTATVTAAGGNVTNTVTIAAPAGVSDPTPGNNSASDTDAVNAGAVAADLTATITNNVSSLLPGETATYTMVISNVGPNGANGAVVTNPAVSGLTKTAVSCVGAGGAVCPVGLTLAQFQAGVAIPTFPSGGSLTFTLTTTVTATTGSVTNTITVATPAGITDPTPSNNSAADTDPIGAVVVSADLAITKTNNLSELIPGQTMAYTIQVSNGGPSAVVGATVSDAAPAGLSFGSWTCSASAGSSCVGAGSGNLVTQVSLAVGGSATFVLNATVALNATGSITNTASVATPAGVTDPATGNNTATDTDTIPSQQIGVEKRAGTVRVVGPASFEIPYTISVINEGRIPLTNVQVSDSLSSTFAPGNPTITLSAPLAATSLGGASASQCAINAGFTGIGSTPSSSTNLLAGNTTLDVSQGCTLTFTVRVVYANAAAVPRTALVNRAIATSSTSPGGAPLTSDTAEAVVTLPLARVDITKALIGVAQVGDEPVFDLSYALVVRNTSDIAAPNVQVIENLSATFAAGSPTITIQSGPTLGGGDASLTLATGANAFNGTTRPAILTGSDTMSPGSSRTISFTVRVQYASAQQVPVGIDLNNSAQATTSVTPGGIVIASDESTDVTNLPADPRPDDVPRPTTARIAPKPLLSVEKVVSTRVIEVGDTLSYAIRITNLGGPTLPSTTVTDRLPLGFSYIDGSAFLSVGASAPQPIGDPTGAPGPVLTFAIPEQPTDQVTVTYRVRVGPGALQGTGVNSAEAATPGAGSVRSNVARAGVIISGGAFTTEACVVGKIFVDLNGNSIQDDQELGVPGVHLTLEEGTSLVSDVEGKYSYCGLTPATHVLKVDRTTLPAGSRLMPSSNRNALDAGSLFVDLKYGEVRRADFIEGSEDPRVLEQVAARRSRGEVWTPSFAASTTPYKASPAPAAFPSLGQTSSVAEAGGEVVLGISGAMSAETIPGSGGVDRPSLSAPNRQAGQPVVLDDTSGAVGVIRLTADRSASASDGLTPVALTIRLIDADGRPLPTPVMATLEITGGQLESAAGPISPAEPVTLDLRPDLPGVQLRIESGEARVRLMPPAVSQDVRVRVTAGAASVEGMVAFLPHLRPLLAVGLIEGQVSLSRLDASAISPVRASEAFDRELRRFSSDFADGDGRIGGRSALFLKGTVKGDYLLTMAYDSEKEDRGVLFRDIQPDAFYPIYGDSSLKGFDAQTSGRFYLRAEQGRSYLLYGDLQTARFATETQSLGTYSRTLTGVQEHYENRWAQVNLFASRDSLTQVIDEFAGLGISGPYTVSNPNGVSGTEKVEVITRDRNQPAVILSAVAQTRYTDYEFEPFSGRLLFRRPVPALDEVLNPMSIRVTYEVDRGGEKSWVAGGDGQVALGSNIRIGGSWAEDRTPNAPYRLRSINGAVKLGATTTVFAEGAQTIGTINTTLFNPNDRIGLGDERGSIEGAAARVELRHDSTRLNARLFAGTSDPGFNNPASTLTGGRTEIGGRGTFEVAKSMQVVGEAIRSEDRLTGGERQGGFLALQAQVAPAVAVEVGVRRAKESIAAAQATSVGQSLFNRTGSFGFEPTTGGRIDPITGLPVFNPGLTPQLSATDPAPQTFEPLDVLTVRGKATLRMSEIANVYGEAEQDVRDSSKKEAAVGGHLRITERTQAYLRHEFISSLDGPYALSNSQRSYNTVFGLSSTYLKNADVFSEYRMRDAVAGRDAHAAIGLRNLWPVATGVNLSTSVERVHSIAGTDRAATAASAGIEFTRNPRVKATGRVEWRQDNATDTWLSTVGLARKISRDWTALAKNYFQQTTPKGALRQLQDRFWLGGAYRDTETNKVNLLSRYEFRFEDTRGLPAFGARRDVHSVSTHVDWHPNRRWTFEGQHAAKWVRDRTDGPLSKFMAQLVSGRAGYDITDRIDLGVLGSLMWSRAEGGRRHAVGAEVGFLLRENLWLSVGYNVTGFTDRDMMAMQQTSRGGFVRLRMKFDEELFAKRPNPNRQ